MKNGNVQYLGEPICDPSFYRRTQAERKRDAKRAERQSERDSRIQFWSRVIMMTCTSLVISVWIHASIMHKPDPVPPVKDSRLEQIDGAISQLQELRDEIDPPDVDGELQPDTP